MQSRAITCYLEELPAAMASGRDRKTWTKAQRHEYLRFGVREAVPGNAQQALRGGAGKKSTGKARQCKSIGGASAQTVSYVPRVLIRASRVAAEVELWKKITGVGGIFVAGVFLNWLASCVSCNSVPLDLRLYWTMTVTAVTCD